MARARGRRGGRWCTRRRLRSAAFVGFRFRHPGDSVELDFAGLAVAGFDGVYDAGAESGLRARRSTRTKMGLAPKSSSRRDSGVENSTMLPFLVEAVVASAAEFGEAVFECVGNVERSVASVGWFSRTFLRRFLRLWASGSALGCGCLHGLDLHFGADDGEEGVGAGAFG